jgi:hypothetical protein
VKSAILTLLVISVIGCTPTAGVVGARAGPPCRWEYDVAVGARAEELRVRAWLPEGSSGDLVMREDAEPYLGHVQVETAPRRWRDLVVRDGRVVAPECARGCTVRYRFALRAAARALSDLEGAIAWGDAVEAPASTWLLRPALAPVGTRYRVHVHSSDGLAFSSGTFLAAEDGAVLPVYEADALTLGVAPHSLFGRFAVRRLEVVPGAGIDLVVLPGALAVREADIAEWVLRSARTAARFFGCFPVPSALVVVVPAEGDAVGRGETMGDGGASIVVELGREARKGALAEDWVLPHEMTHLFVPSLPRTYHWIEEGLAMYFEPIARARLGQLPPERVWQAFADEMPLGQPTRPGDALDGTSSWRRTYWGGALFCLVADLEIRRRTGGRLGLEDAIRGVLAQGGSVAEVWSMGRLLDAADAAVGSAALRDLYEATGAGAWTFDLPRLFRDLGAGGRGRLASMRRAITEATGTGGTPKPTLCSRSMPASVMAR